MNRTTLQFFELLKSGLWGTSPNPNLFSGEVDWLGIYEMAERQTVMGICLDGVLLLPPKYLPEIVLMMEWVGMTEKIKIHNKIVNKRATEISRFFQMGGFRSTVLKGQGTALLYAHPECRQSGDIDLWIEGDRDKVFRYAKSFGKITSIDIKHADFRCFDDVPVEIHTIPTWFYNPIVNKRLKKWMLLVQNDQFNRQEMGFGVPSVRFNLVYSIIHIYRHLFEEGIGLRQMMDYYYILMNSTLKERHEAFSHLCSFGMSRFVGAVMYVLKIVFAIDDTFLLCVPSIKYGKRLLDDIIIGGNFGHYNESNSHGLENCIQRGIRNIRHNSHLLFDYPSEVLWSPIWKCWHWCWRKTHGYL